MTRPFRFGFQLPYELAGGRTRCAISYFAVKDIEAFGPVISALGNGTSP